VIDYAHSHVATETEAKEIVKQAAAFYELVETWIAMHHTAFKKV